MRRSLLAPVPALPPFVPMDFKYSKIDSLVMFYFFLKNKCRMSNACSRQTRSGAMRHAGGGNRCSQPVLGRTACTRHAGPCGAGRAFADHQPSKHLLNSRVDRVAQQKQHGNLEAQD